MRDAERLVQVQVADVAAEAAGTRESDERVQVRTVDVHLTTGVVDGRADLADLLLVDAVRRRIGDHDRGQALGVVGDLRPQVVEIDVTVLAARHDLDPHTSHDRGRGVGTVRTGGDKAGVAVVVTTAEVVVADREQTRVLALAAAFGCSSPRRSR